VSEPVAVSVVVDSLPLVAGPITFKPQSGLFEQRVTVTNNTAAAVSAVRVLVLGLLDTIQVHNASGRQDGVPYVQCNQTLEQGAAITMVIEYYSRQRIPPNPTFIAQVVPSESPTDPYGTIVRITRQARLADGSFMIEFLSVAGGIHYIQCSTDLKQWKTVQPSVRGTGYSLQWIDNGPPMTDSYPSGTSCRFYRVMLIP
jgi:hypothetical protein